MRTSTGSAATPARPASAPGGRGAAAARWGAARRGAQRQVAAQAAARKRWAGMLGTKAKLPDHLLMAQTIDLWATRKTNDKRALVCASCAATHVGFSADGNMRLVAGMTRHLHER